MDRTYGCTVHSCMSDTTSGKRSAQPQATGIGRSTEQLKIACAEPHGSRSLSLLFPYRRRAAYGYGVQGLAKLRESAVGTIALGDTDLDVFRGAKHLSAQVYKSERSITMAYAGQAPRAMATPRRRELQWLRVCMATSMTTS